MDFLRPQSISNCSIFPTTYPEARNLSHGQESSKFLAQKLYFFIGSSFETFFQVEWRILRRQQDVRVLIIYCQVWKYRLHCPCARYRSTCFLFRSLWDSPVAVFWIFHWGVKFFRFCKKFFVIFGFSERSFVLLLFEFDLERYIHASQNKNVYQKIFCLHRVKYVSLQKFSLHWELFFWGKH